MAKPQLSLSERIAERAKKKQRHARGGANRAEFLLMKDEIAKALDDQWPVKEIWATLREEGAISFSYDAFMGYVRRLITNTKGARKATQKPETATATSSENLAAKRNEPARSVPVPKPVASQAFHFNPKPSTRRD